MKFVVSRQPLRALLAASCLLLLTGCMTAKKYRLASKDTPPPVPLAWTAEAPPVRVTVEHVIVFKGPGAWKREARWDEFVVRLDNFSEASFQVDAVALLDLHGAPHFPGEDPWALEKLSYTNWEKYGKTGLKLAAGAGAVVLYGGLLTAATVGSALSGGAAAGGALFAANVIPVVAVVNIGAVALMNNQNKKKVVAEFQRRRMPAALEVPAHGSRQGSWFFPMTPAPQALSVRGTWRGERVELLLPLPELARLHLKPPKRSAAH